MGLNKPTGNLMSNILIAQTIDSGVVVTPGMAATICKHTDRKAATVVKVEVINTRCVITVQEDLVVADPSTENEIGHQNWIAARNETGIRYLFRRTKNEWRQVAFNRSTNHWNVIKGGSALILGTRDHYFDWSF